MGYRRAARQAVVPPRLCILPWGDSITQSNNTHLTCRHPLREDLKEAGYEFDFIGSENSNFGGTPTYPDPSFDRDYEGHWGWRVDEIHAQIQRWFGGYTPDVVLMHLGTNDAFQSQSTDSTIDELTVLVGMLRAEHERVVILLAKLIPTTQYQRNLDALNGRFDEFAVSLTIATSPVVVVDQASGFNPNVNADTFCPATIARIDGDATIHDREVEVVGVGTRDFATVERASRIICLVSDLG